MKKYLTIITFFISLNILSQTKKEQIKILTERVDSLNRVVGEERSSNSQKQLTYKEQISSLQNQLENLNTSLTKTKEELNQNIVDLKNSNQELLNKSMEIRELGNRLNERDKQIVNLRTELEELKISINLEESNLSSDLDNDILELKNQISNLTSNSDAKEKIIQHISDRYNEHLELLKTLGDEGSEEMTLRSVYSNDYFFAYEVNVEGYYGGAHEEVSSEQFLFEIKTGDLKNLKDLILQSKRADLLNILNQKLKKSENELIKCLGNKDYENLVFTNESLEQLKLQEEGITIEYWLSYLEKACNPIINLNKSDATLYFDSRLFK
ncbi:MAG: hypothetical protein ACKO7P_14050 [Bacteroidota bacterium]